MSFTTLSCLQLLSLKAQLRIKIILNVFITFNLYVIHFCYISTSTLTKTSSVFRGKTPNPDPRLLAVFLAGVIRGACPANKTWIQHQPRRHDDCAFSQHFWNGALRHGFTRVHQLQKAHLARSKSRNKTADALGLMTLRMIWRFSQIPM